MKIRSKWHGALAALGIGSLFIYLWDLQKGQRSEYYAAIAVSMSKNFSNFFFGAMDPAGTVTLDKIPGSYWVPAIFVKIFGFSTWSVNTPNAIAATATVIISAITVKNLYGKTAGLIAGAIVATTPILAAVARSNQPQTYFLLTLSLAALFATKALENNSRKYLIISGAWIALGFHTYMLEAWALWPALMFAYAFTNQSKIQKLKDILIAGITSLLLSLTWIIIVTIIPASHRPYIGGTYHNNPIEMVFGYNGLGRFKITTQELSSSTDDPTFRSFTPPFGGHASISRLFNLQVGGQIAWLIPTAVIAVLIAIIYKEHKAITAFYAGWFVTFFAMFSAVGGIHQFYVSSLALPIGALIASAIAIARKKSSTNAEIALLATTAIWVFFLAHRYTNYISWAPLAQAFFAVAAIIFLTIKFSDRLKFVIPIILISAFTFTPALWALDTRNHASAINPIAGPEMEMGGGMGGPQGFDRHDRKPPQGFNSNQLNPNQMGPQNFKVSNQGMMGGFNPFGNEDNSELIKYLQSNRNGAKYLLATFGGMSAAPFITATGDNILPIGGFDGQDPSPTLIQFQKLINSGELKYILVGGNGMRPGNSVNNDSDIVTWVNANCQRDTAAPGNSFIYTCSKKF